jgi:hypothetical protein
MGTRTPPPPKAVSIDNSRFNQALDAILDFDDEKVSDAFFDLLDVLKEKENSSGEKTVIIYPGALPNSDVKEIISETLFGIPVDQMQSEIHIAKESNASFQSFIQAVAIYRRESKKDKTKLDIMNYQIIPWFLHDPSDAARPPLIADEPTPPHYVKQKILAAAFAENARESITQLWDEINRLSIDGLDDKDYNKKVRPLLVKSAKKVAEVLHISKLAAQSTARAAAKANEVARAAEEAEAEAEKVVTAAAGPRLIEETVFRMLAELLGKSAGLLKEIRKLVKDSQKFRPWATAAIQDGQLAGTICGAGYSSYGASLLDRVKYEGLLAKMFIARIKNFLDDKTKKPEVKQELGRLLEELSNANIYNRVRSQIRNFQKETESYKTLQDSLNKLKGMLDPAPTAGADRNWAESLYRLNPASNCINPLMKSLQSIRVQKSLFREFKKAGVEKEALPFAAVAEVTVSEGDITKYKLDTLPAARPDASVAPRRDWLMSKAQGSRHNCDRLVHFTFGRADAPIDLRNKIKLDGSLFLKTLVKADGENYIPKKTDIEDKKVEIITRDLKDKNFDDGTPMPPVTTMRYRHSQTEVYSYTERFDVQGDLHVELTSPVTDVNRDPKVAALEFARRLQRQVIFSAPLSYSRESLLRYLMTITVTIDDSDLPEDLPFKMMKDALEKVGFCSDRILQQVPERVFAAKLGTSTPPPPAAAPSSLSPSSSSGS